MESSLPRSSPMPPSAVSPTSLSGLPLRGISQEEAFASSANNPPRGHGRLPPLGSAIDRLAQRLDASPMRFASHSQREWICAANATLEALRGKGGHLEGYQLIAYPAGALPRWIESFASGWRRSARGLGRSPALNRLSKAANGRLHSTAVAADTAESRRFMDGLSHALGSGYAARSFIVAHEFAHAWQASRRHELITELCGRVGGMFAVEVSLFCDPFRSDGRASNAGKLFALLEESLSDALGAWVLRVQGHATSFQAASAFRSAQAKGRPQDFPYRTSWLLDELAVSATSREATIADFWRFALDAACARGPALFSNFNPLRNFDPETGLPSALARSI